MADRLPTSPRPMKASNRDAPVVCGVYFLFKEGVLIYVGQSKDCHARISNHRTNGREFDLATVMPLQAEFIGQVEAALIKGYRPSKNVAKVGKPQSIIVPPARVVEGLAASAPGPDGLGTISRSKSRSLAQSYGLRADIIDNAVAHGALTFSATRRNGRGFVSVAMFLVVDAFLKAKQQERLIELGLASSARLTIPSTEGVSHG